MWYLCYHENGRRRQPRIGPDRVHARRSAAEINAQLEVGAPSALGFEPVSFAELRQRWLDHHEHVRRSSVRTIDRYRAATDHLLRFVKTCCPLRHVSEFKPGHAEQFVRYLRSLKVAPNGHENARKRKLRDSSVKYTLEACSTLFNYAYRHRHLSPYADNAFRMIENFRIPVEDSKPVEIFTPDQENAFFEASDDWQFPLFLPLALTGLRPGELTHLLLPDDFDSSGGWLYIRNKPFLSWRVDIPIPASLMQVLSRLAGERATGPVFTQRRCHDGYSPPLEFQPTGMLERELTRRLAYLEDSTGNELARNDKEALSRTVWRDVGALREDCVRIEFMRVTKTIGLPHITAPKTFRHTFATILQDANVDPLIRNELMGHSPASTFGSDGSLGMTGVYTHTRPETKRRQLEHALGGRPAISHTERRLAKY